MRNSIANTFSIESYGLVGSKNVFDKKDSYLLKSCNFEIIPIMRLLNYVSEFTGLKKVAVNKSSKVSSYFLIDFR